MRTSNAKMAIKREFRMPMRTQGRERIQVRSFPSQGCPELRKERRRCLQCAKMKAASKYKIKNTKRRAKKRQQEAEGGSHHGVN